MLRTPRHDGERDDPDLPLTGGLVVGVPSRLPVSAATDPPAQRPRGLFLLLGALSGLTPFAIDGYLPALPSLTRDLQTTSSATQLTLAALLVGLAFGQLVAGVLSDRVGRRLPVLIGLTGFVLASIGCALAPTIEVLIGLRFLQGFAGAAAVVVSRAVVRDLFEGAAMARAFASLILVVGVAPVLAPVVGAQALRFTSWRGVFVALALLGIALLIATWRRLPESLPPERRSDGGLRQTRRTFAHLLRDPGFVLPSLVSGAAFASLFAYIAGSPYVLQEVYGLSPQTFSLVFAGNAALFITLSQVGGRLVQRTGAVALLLTGVSIGLTGGLLVLVSTLTGLGLPGVLPGLLLVVGAIGLTAPNATALALADHGRTAGSASALLGVLQFTFGALAAPLTGLGGSRTALPLALTVTGACVLALLFALGTARRVNATASMMAA